MQNSCTRRVELFCAKNPWKKHQILEKWDDFENRPSCKGYIPCKGYRFFKMVSLVQKLKWPKTCAKRVFKKTKVLCKNPLEKNEIFEKWDDFENPPSCKGYGPCKGCSPCKMFTFKSKIKMSKNMRKTVVKEDKSSVEKPLEKTPNIRKMRRFWRSGILQRL